MFRIKFVITVRENYDAERVVRSRFIYLVVLERRDDPCIKQVPVLKIF